MPWFDGSSGDLLLDRRFAWAEALAAEDDNAAAAELLAEIVAAKPDWAPGWRAVAETREALGDRGGAAAAWREVARLDPEGLFGAALHLARLGDAAPRVMPGGYVGALFDGYAPRFEQHLVEALGYRGPALVVAALDRVAPGRRFARALDLGCGTGLMGRALVGRVDELDGIDLSARMVEAARRTGFYAAVSIGAAEDALAAVSSGAYGLVVAADVLPYLGDLARLFAGAARALAPGGLLAVTAQRRTEPGYGLGPDLRFAHAPDYVREVLRAAGLAPVYLEHDWARRENGADVPGLVAVADRA